METDKTLIISPTGCDPFFDPEFDSGNHWRFRKPGRTYEVCLVVFDDIYQPPIGTYDHVLRMKGRKWNLLPEICDFIKWENYDHIGFWDDDYCTDIQNLERALELGRGLPYFQQSLTSWTVYPILQHDPRKKLAATNFIELGVPFFRQDMFSKVLYFLRHYQYKESDWGIDKILSHYLDSPAYVIHDSKVKHMRRESSYSKEAGFQEMDYLMKEWYPKFSLEKLGRKYDYLDQQIEFWYTPK